MSAGRTIYGVLGDATPLASANVTLTAANGAMRRPRSVLLGMTMQRLQMVTFVCSMTVIDAPLMSGSATLPRAATSSD